MEEAQRAAHVNEMKSREGNMYIDYERVLYPSRCGFCRFPCGWGCKGHSTFREEGGGVMGALNVSMP